MNNAQKTSRLITKLINQSKSDAKLIADLGKQLQAARDEAVKGRYEAAEACEKAVAASDKKLQASLDEAFKARREASDTRDKLAVTEWSTDALRKQVLDLYNSLTAVKAELLASSTALSQAQDEIRIIRAINEAEAVVARENADILDKLQPQIEGIELARQDLSKILDTVRDRLKRKELEAECAILNRQVIAGSRPDLNRR